MEPGILPEGERPAVGWWPLAGTNLGSAAGWWSKTNQQVLLWLAEDFQVAQISVNLNPIETLWYDFKYAVYVGKASNVAELQQFCKDEWGKNPPQLEKTHSRFGL